MTSRKNKGRKAAKLLTEYGLTRGKKKFEKT